MMVQRVRVGSAYSEEFEVKVSVHQASVLSLLVFAIVVDIITKNARRGVVNELLYTDDLVFMSKNHGRLKGKVLELEGSTGKDLKVNTRITKVMVSGSEEVFKSKIDLCGVCGRRVMANSVLFTKSGNEVHGRCAKMKEVTTRLAMHFVCSKL